MPPAVHAPAPTPAPAAAPAAASSGPLPVVNADEIAKAKKALAEWTKANLRLFGALGSAMPEWPPTKAQLVLDPDAVALPMSILLS